MNSTYNNSCRLKSEMEKIPVDKKHIIETKDGPICGLIEKHEERQYYKFQSIPYAQPPLGRLRFLPPTPVGAWKDLRDCTQPAPTPLACHYDDETIFGSEDCLYIEVTTPSVKPKQLLPVMFWICCYDFMFTSYSINEPTLLLNENVVFVSCGFRLGAFGFLSVQGVSAPGNSGLKDIVAALKWVQKNISAFGGDPNNVTIFGNSGGGIIVHSMIISPMATGLFHKAVIQSGSALSNWCIDKNPIQNALQLAKIFGIEKTCPTDLVEELQALPADDILIASLNMWKLSFESDERNFLIPVFKPCIEIEFEGQSCFLTKNPMSLLKSGNFNRVPLLIGSNNTEGNLLQYVMNNFYADFDKYNNDVNLLVPRTLAGVTERTKEIGQQLLQFYFGDQGQLTEHTKTQYIQLISDYYFLYYVNKTVRVHKEFAPETPLYYYILNYSGDWRVPVEWQFLNAMGHTAEIPFLFEVKLPNNPKKYQILNMSKMDGSKDSVRTRSRVVKMWTNFAKYGNPTPEEDDPLLQFKWDPVENEHKLNYLSIGSELTKGVNPFQERMNFWDELHRDYLFHRSLVYFNDSGIFW